MNEYQVAAISAIEIETEWHRDLGQTEDEYREEVEDEINGYLHWPVKP